MGRLPPGVDLLAGVPESGRMATLGALGALPNLQHQGPVAAPVTPMLRALCSHRTTPRRETNACNRRVHVDLLDSRRNMFLVSLTRSRRVAYS